VFSMRRKRTSIAASNMIIQRPSKPFVFAIFGSIFFHASLLVVTFSDKPPVPLQAQADLDVVLVNSRSIRQTSVTDALAQTNLQGGGNTERDVMLSSNLPLVAVESNIRRLEMASKQLQELERSVAELMQIEKNSNARLPDAVEGDTSMRRDGLDAIDTAESKKLFLAKLEAKIEKEWSDYQKRPRRKFLGVNVREAEFANYVDRWRSRVEEFGTKFYSEQTRSEPIFGKVLVTVSISSQGEIVDVSIDKSSGHKVLDQAVSEIIKLASPFPVFDTPLRKKYDILTITRFWSFTRSDLALITN